MIKGQLFSLSHQTIIEQAHKPRIQENRQSPRDSGVCVGVTV